VTRVGLHLALPFWYSFGCVNSLGPENGALAELNVLNQKASW